jgi:peptide/nickel transport system ATP-binding protein
LKELLDVKDLVVRYRGADEPTLKGVSLSIQPGERLALVGESGSGKSTLARALLGLAPVIGGEVSFQGRNVIGDSHKLNDQDYRRRVQMIFQDPYNSLHPRLSVQSNLMEPLKIHGLYDAEQSRAASSRVLERVGLDPEAAQRYPHQFSGGQLQRIGIARALLMEPLLLLADEPVSALDVSVQAQVLNLLADLSSDGKLAILFISHDLAVVRHLCDRVAVMLKGKLVEVGTVDQICFEPQHAYTQTLVQATLAG